MADFLKALIALAAAGVKLREGRERGVGQHAARAQALFEQVMGELGRRDPLPWPGPQGARSFASELAGTLAMPAVAQESLLPFLLMPQPHDSDVIRKLGQ